MSEMNRTVQSIKNARVSLFFSVLVLVLGFFSRKILIDCLGAEVLLHTHYILLCFRRIMKL